MDIRLLVPHSGAMCLLDRVLHSDSDTLCAEVTIRQSSVFLQKDGVGAWVGIEYMAQAIAAYAGTMAHLEGHPIKVGFLLGTRQYDCSQSHFTIGMVLQIKVRHTLQVANGLSSFDCRIHEGEILMASATITVFQPDNLNEYSS